MGNLENSAAETEVSQMEHNEESTKQLSNFFITQCRSFTEQEISLQIQKLEESKTNYIDNYVDVSSDINEFSKQAIRINGIQNNLNMLKAMQIANANHQCSSLKQEFPSISEGDKKKLEK